MHGKRKQYLDVRNRPSRGADAGQVLDKVQVYPGKSRRVIRLAVPGFRHPNAQGCRMSRQNFSAADPERAGGAALTEKGKRVFLSNTRRSRHHAARAVLRERMGACMLVVGHQEPRFLRGRCRPAEPWAAPILELDKNKCTK